MPPHFETFQGRGSKNRHDPIPTIALMKQGPNTRLGVNSRGDELLGKPPFIELLYDPKARIVGVRACAESTPYSYALEGARRSGRTGWQVSAGAFVAHYGITVSETITRVATLDGDVLFIALDDAAVESSSPNPAARKGRKK
jgi:hypothetical protein